MGAVEVRELFDDEYAGLVRLAAVITGDAHVGEEVVQEAFARAVARWRRLRDYERPGAWLRLVVVRLAVRARDRRRREPAVAAIPERATPGPDAEVLDLLAALRRLTPMQRAAVALFHLEDLPVDDVAALLRIPASTVRSHLHRGRAALAPMLAAGSEAEEAQTHAD